jgi:hypothetical protein
MLRDGKRCPAKVYSDDAICSDCAQLLGTELNQRYAAWIARREDER